MVDQF